MLRKKLIDRKSNDDIEWKNRDILRIEAFSDAIFAFSITLLIVSLEVPKNFHELMQTMKGFFAFAISFSLLFKIWYEQFVFFRRYGIEDLYTTLLNSALLFVVLFFMYPLKFLFNLIIPGGNIEGEQEVISTQELPILMIIYGAGFIAIYLIFALLYGHALKNKDELQLTEKEVFATKSQMIVFYLLLGIGLGSVACAYFVPPESAGFAGLFYLLIWPTISIFFRFRNKIYRKKFES